MSIDVDYSDSILLAALAEVASGAAHELNNPLAVISGRAQLMRERVASAEEEKVWEQIISETGRISDIVSLLMKFAAPLAPRPETIALRPLLEEMIERPEFSGGRITIATDEDGDPIKISCDREQVDYAITEILKNASFHACDKVTISIKKLDKEVEIKMSDNGPGMCEETVRRAFTPFFSARQAGRGKGLGLSIAWRYINLNNGSIYINSELKIGTTVVLTLPSA